MIWTHDMYSLGVIVRSLLYSNHRVELFLLLLVGVSFTRWISVFDGTMIWKTLRLDFSDIQTFLVASQKDLFRSIIDTMDPQRLYANSRERFHYLFDRSFLCEESCVPFFFFFFFCRKSLAAGFHFRGTNWSYSAVYAITWSPVIDCVPTNCRGCNELITSPADNRRDGQMVKSSNHRPPPGQGFRTQGSRNVWETGKSRGVSSFFFHEKRDPVLGCVASLLTIRFEWIFEEKKKRKERNEKRSDWFPSRARRGTRVCVREIHLPMLLLESQWVHWGFLCFFPRGEKIAARSIERCALKRVPSDFLCLTFCGCTIQSRYTLAW